MRFFIAALLTLAFGLAGAAISHADPSNWGLPSGSWGTQNTVTVPSSTPSPILPNRANRNYLLIQNNGGATIYVTPGGPPSPTGNQGIAITTGTSWAPVPPPSTPIYVYASPSPVPSITVIEGIQH